MMRKRELYRLFTIITIILTVLSGFFAWGNVLVIQFRNYAVMTFFASLGALVSVLVPYIILHAKRHAECKFRSEVPCPYYYVLSQLGLEDVYPSTSDERYKEDVANQLALAGTPNGRLHASFDDPVILLGVSLGTFFVRDGVIKEATLNIPATVHIKMFTCHIENKELEWRQKKFSVNGEGGNLRPNPDGTLACIQRFNDYWNRFIIGREHTVLWNNDPEKEAKEPLTPFKECFPSATICIVNDVIFFTPTLVDIDNYRESQNQQAKDAGCLSFRIKRDSLFGERLEYLFKHVYILEPK